MGWQLPLDSAEAASVNSWRVSGGSRNGPNGYDVHGSAVIAKPLRLLRVFALIIVPKTPQTQTPDNLELTLAFEHLLAVIPTARHGSFYVQNSFPLPVLQPSSFPNQRAYCSKDRFPNRHSAPSLPHKPSNDGLL